MNNLLIYIMLLPICIGLALFLVPKRFDVLKGITALVTTGIVLYFGVSIFLNEETFIHIGMEKYLRGTAMSQSLAKQISPYLTFSVDALSQLITLFLCVFAFLIQLYSLNYNSKTKSVHNFYSYCMITLVCAIGATLSENLFVFLFFWGILGFTLYKLIPGKDKKSSETATKTIILVGGSDCLMILGIALLWNLEGTVHLSELTVATDTLLSNIACISLLIGAFTKAGAFPFHTWVPDYARDASAASAAYLPASLDKLLGIYFMMRLCSDVFVLNEWLRFSIILIGVVTIIIAVMMALMQHNYKRLLGYHAVSQVGYMVAGLGMGTALGIAGGLFHMVNHALYKSGLLLSAGAIEQQTGTDTLEQTGGLSKAMPVTYIATLIFALSISGVPPLNGFASKWMIYQGFIEFGQGAGIANQLWIVWLGLAVLGSALTLASFLKFVSGIFLGRKKPEFKEVREVPVAMWLPLVFLALCCMAFGVFASGYVVPRLIMPCSGNFEFIGIWNSTAVSVLILLSILLGAIIYYVGNIWHFRSDDSFIGGEVNREETAYPVVEFYKTLHEFSWLSILYNRAERKWFDIYELGKKITWRFFKILSAGHTGVLSMYALWIVCGFLILCFILLL